MKKLYRCNQHTALNDENPEIRSLGAKFLGVQKHKLAIPALIIASKDSHPNVRKEAIEALGKIKDRTTVQTLLDALNDEDISVASAANRALFFICLPEIVKILKPTNKNEEDIERNSDI